MKRQTINLPDDLGALIERTALHAGVWRGHSVSQNTIIVELIQRGLATVADEPGWKDAIEAAKGGEKK
jgi:hypothetical protein